MIVETIRDNLYCIRVPSPTLPPATTTNCWILGQQGGWIVDPAAHKPETQTQLEGLLKDFSPSGIFLTHHHHDHIGAANVLSERFRIPIIAHPCTAELLNFKECIPWQDGQIFTVANEEWTAVHTPGHAPGHLCLLSNLDGSMVAGDMVAGEGTILINPQEGSIREYLSSLKLMEQLAPSRLLPAHGDILTNGIQTLYEFQAHRRQRLLQIERLLTAFPQTTRMIAEQIYTDLPKSFLGIASIQVECGLLYLEEDHKAQMVASEDNVGWIYSKTTNGVS